MNAPQNNLRQSGFGMIEVLVTLIILLVGLLGLAGLMVQSQRSEMESYQRVQALILLQDMEGRINANRNVRDVANVSCYAYTTNLTNGTKYLGGAPGDAGLLALPAACAQGTPTQITQFNNDLAAWNQLLRGSAESSGGTNVGAMIGARGCISYDAASELPEYSPTTGVATGNILAGTGIYTLSIAWQGMGDTFANTNLLCGKGMYTNEAQRRVVSLTFRIGAIAK